MQTKTNTKCLLSEYDKWGALKYKGLTRCRVRLYVNNMLKSKTRDGLDTEDGQGTRDHELAAILLVMVMVWSTGMIGWAQEIRGESSQRAKDEAVYRGFLALEPNKLYPTRLKASDPGAWNQVKLQALTPTNGVTVDDTGVFKPVMENNIAYLLKTCQVDPMLYYFRERAGQKPL